MQHVLPTVIFVHLNVSMLERFVLAIHNTNIIVRIVKSCANKLYSVSHTDAELEVTVSSLRALYEDRAVLPRTLYCRATRTGALWPAAESEPNNINNDNPNIT